MQARAPVCGTCPRAFRILQPRITRRSAVRCVARAGETKQLPIFPLNVVALPYATVPLMIFEARYRVLFNTILAGEAGVEEGLVQGESPFCGSRRFGMCFVGAGPDGKSAMATIGTELEVVDFAHVQDGRIFVTSKGRERFRVRRIVRERPIMVAEVEELEEEEYGGEEVATLASEVADLLRSTIRLNIKLNNIEVSDDQLEPEELAGLGPRELSYWVASFFSEIKPLQQLLLEETSTVSRLTQEKKVLTDTVRYYSATVALKSVTASPSSDTAPEMDLDGPIIPPQSPAQEQQQPRESASSSGAEDGKERGKEQ